MRAKTLLIISGLLLLLWANIPEARQLCAYWTGPYTVPFSCLFFMGYAILHIAYWQHSQDQD